MTKRCSCAVAILVAAGSLAMAQGPEMTVAQAVEAALGHYPAVRVSQEQMNAAAAGIRLARTAYLPRVDGLATVNRATRNNVFGLLLPQSVIPSISGPVLGTNNFGMAWESAAGVLVSWEPFDLGLRRASVEAASAARAHSETTLERTQFEVAVAAADAALTVVAADETIRAAQAAVERAEVLVRTVRALVDAQLRPGAEASRAEAELAAARTQLLQAQQAAAVARATLGRFTGGEPSEIRLRAGPLTAMPPEAPATALETAAGNPLAKEQDAAVEQARAQLKALDRAYAPHFLVQGSAYARGSGAETDGRILGGLNGLGPSTQNYALGFSVLFPAFDRPAVRAREAAQSATLRAEQARYEQITTDLKAQWNAARAAWEGARGIAANTPVEVSAARAAVAQATARYQAGLGTVIEVAEAQRLLTQAEIDDALARLNLWRARLQMATAQGDIQPFVAAASQ
jgi:outer membrane protein